MPSVRGFPPGPAPGREREPFSTAPGKSQAGSPGKLCRRHAAPEEMAPSAVVARSACDSPAPYENAPGSWLLSGRRRGALDPLEFLHFGCRFRRISLPPVEAREAEMRLPRKRGLVFNRNNGQPCLFGGRFIAVERCRLSQ